MKVIGKNNQYHATVTQQLAGYTVYDIYGPDGRHIATGKRHGTEQEVSDYIQQTVLKRYNAGGDTLAAEYFNTTHQQTELQREILDVIA